MARGRSTAITKLAKAVQGIKRDMKVEKDVNYYGDTHDNLLVSSDFAQYCLTGINSRWTSCFGAAASDGEQNQCIHKGFGLDMYFSQENGIANEEETTHYTLFVVKLKDAAANIFTNAASPTLSLTNGTDYFKNGGFVFINKKRFDILYHKRFTLTNFGTVLTASAGQSQFGNNLRLYRKFKGVGKIVNPAGNWKNLNCPNDPSQNIFVLLFNDNSAADAEYPKMNLTAVHTVITN